MFEPRFQSFLWSPGSVRFNFCSLNPTCSIWVTSSVSGHLKPSNILSNILYIMLSTLKWYWAIIRCFKSILSRFQRSNHFHFFKYLYCYLPFSRKLLGNCQNYPFNVLIYHLYLISNQWYIGTILFYKTCSFRYHQ